jgi:transposase
MTDISFLYPHPTLFQCQCIEFNEEAQQITIRGCLNQASAFCSLCSQPTSRIHSRYERRLADLPWAEYPVQILLRVKRFFCDNFLCKRMIFTERMPAIMKPWARRTNRLADSQTQIGLALGGRPGAKLAQVLRMPAGGDLLLKLVRQIKLPPRKTPTVLGVDDWAMKKAHHYGTILVDLERGEIMDMLPDRTSESLAQWLESHPEVEIVSRDRAEAYAEGIRQGAPTATQVADRWHLIKNVAEALFKVLEKYQKKLATLWKESMAGIPVSETADEHSPASVTEPASLVSQAGEERHQRITFVKQLAGQGWSQSDIAKQIPLDRKTVRRYLRMPAFPIPITRNRTSILDEYKPYLRQRWQAGCRNAAQLYRELQSRGFQGKASIVRDFVRKELKSTMKQTNDTQMPAKFSLRAFTWLPLKKKQNLKEHQQRLIQAMKDVHPDVQKAITLSQSFVMMVRERKENLLSDWLISAAESELKTFAHFAKRLKRDESAVRAALSLPWSNGPTEGFVNKLKNVKRQMYGRAKLDLLRIRLLAW